MMRRQAGFTLLEVLVATAIFGLVLLALGQGLQFGLQAWRSQARSALWPDEVEGIDRTLRRVVGAAEASSFAPTGPLQGTALRMVVITRFAPHGGGPALPTEAVLQVDASRRLLLQLTPAWPVRWLARPPSETVVLSSGLERVEFAYWQSAGRNAAAGWTQVWQSKALPALVRIRLVFPASDPRHWPDLIVAPAIGALAASAPGALQAAFGSAEVAHAG